MATIDQLLDEHAGMGLSTENGVDTFKVLFNATADDLAALRTSIVGITAQLDLDAGVTDTDYAANHDPAATSLVKGT